MVKDAAFEKLFGFKRREAEEAFKTGTLQSCISHSNGYRRNCLKLAQHAKELTGSNKICLSGGVALNCVANGKLQQQQLFDEIFIQPAGGDAGGSVGAALAAYHLYFEKNVYLLAGSDAWRVPIWPFFIYWWHHK